MPKIIQAVGISERNLLTVCLCGIVRVPESLMMTNICLMKITLAAAAAFVLATTVASSAADQAVKAAPALIPPAPPTWTPGVGLGSTEFLDPSEDFLYPPARLNGFGANVGVTAGCNWQVRSFVLGAEGDWSWTNFSKSQIGYADVTDPSTIASGSSGSRPPGLAPAGRTTTFYFTRQAV